MFLNQEIEGEFILKELKKLPHATKGRLHFLSPDSEANYLKIANRKDVYGKSVFRLCHGIITLCGITWESGAHRYSIPAVKAHLLYLLYGNGMGSFSYKGKLWE